MFVMRTRVMAMVMVFSSAAASAQPCRPEWQGFDPSTARLAGTDGSVSRMTMWDPDGDGSSGPVLVVGGSFSVAGDEVVNDTALFDPASGAWSTLAPSATGVRGPFAVLPNGDLVAAGSFTGESGESVIGVARWDRPARRWSLLGPGVGGQFPYVMDLIVLPSGDLVVGGSFSTIGDMTVNGIARWDGSAWSPMGSGVLGSGNAPSVIAMAVLPDGTLAVGGRFSIAGDVLARHMAVWDGSAWAPLGSGISGFEGVYTLAVLPNGNLIAGGRFSQAGGVEASQIAQWDHAAQAWSPVGSGISGSAAVLSLVTLPNGDLVAGGRFTNAGGVAVSNVARWDGSTWSGLGSGIGPVYPTISVSELAVLPNGEVIAGGNFVTAGGARILNIARWDGSVWSPLGDVGMDDVVEVVAVLPNGDMLAGGAFTRAGGEPARGIAHFGGSTWSALGSGLGPTATVLAIESLPDGGFVVGGAFANAGGVRVNNIACWDGAWTPLRTGVDGTVEAIAVMPDGDIVAGGDIVSVHGVPTNRIARWDRSTETWSRLSTGLNGTVYALAVLPNGDLIAGGNFSTAGNVAASRIARWDGVAWSPLGTGITSSSSVTVRALEVTPNGDLIAGGLFTNAGGVTANSIARWDGSLWSPLGSGIGDGDSHVLALDMMTNGDLVAGGEFITAGGIAATRVARWNGSAWSALDSGVNGPVWALAALPDGGLVAGGYFTRAGGVAAPYLARWDCPPCPADFNHDGVVNSADLYYFIAVLFAPAPDQSAADFNVDGVVNSQDFFDFLEAMFGGC